MIEAMSLYNNKEYAKASKKIESTLRAFSGIKENHKNELIFYQGLSRMASDQFEKAEESFLLLNGLMIFRYNSDLLWYEALNHLARGKEDQCVKILQDIVFKKVKPFHLDAGQLLIELQN